MPTAASTTAFHVRRARLADLPFVQQDGNVPPHEIRRKMEMGDIFVADHGVAPIGMLRAEYFLSDLPFIASVFVLDIFRRRGVGRLLVDQAGRAMRERGHRVLYASAATDQSATLSWMRRLGFNECGFLAGSAGEAGTLFLRKPL